MTKPRGGSGGGESPKRPHLGISLLGHVSVTYNGEPFVFATRRKALPLLCMLLLHRDEDLTRDYAAFALYPDLIEEDAHTKLRGTIYDLQRVLPPDGGTPWFLATGINLRWNPAANATFDVTEFESACAAGEAALGRAIDLYGGDLLEGLHEEWIYAERERLRSLLIDAIERGIGDARKDGRTLDAIAYAQRLLTMDPYREDVMRRIMTLRNERGDRTAALAEYRRFERLIREELGVEPMAETQALRDAIARDDLAFEAAGGEPETRPVAAVATFVGRERELAKLREAWGRARRRAGSLTFVGGEAGAGKSALVAEFAREVAESGGRVLLGTTSSPEAQPYESAIEALRGALPLVGALRIPPVWMATLIALMPELRARVERVAPLAELGGEALGERVREAIARAVVGLAGTRPVLLILEDAHCAAGATLALVTELSRRIATAPVVVAVTYRTDEVARTHPLAATIRESLANPSVEQWALPPLEPADVETLLERSGKPQELTAKIFAISHGNAFFASQLVASDSNERAVPQSVEAFVASRIARLPEAVRHVAEIAAQLGAQFSRECVGSVAGWNESELGDALDDLIARRIVRERSGRGAFDFAFTHELVRNALLAAAPGTPDRHRRIARILEESLPELAGDLAATIASHYERAGDTPAAVVRYRTAAQRALDLGALADAERAIARGLALATDAPTRVTLLKLVVDASDRASVAAGNAALDELEALARETAGSDLFDFVAIRRADSALLTFAENWRETLEAVRIRAGATGSRRVSQLADFFDGHANMLLGETKTAVRQLEAILPAMEREGELRRVVVTLADLATGYNRLGMHAESAAALERLAAFEDPALPYPVRLVAVRSPFSLAQENGDAIEAERAALRWIELAIRAGDRRAELAARESAAWPLLVNQRCAAALESLDAAREIGRELGLATMTVGTLTNRALALLRVGAIGEAREVVETSGYEDRPLAMQSTIQSTLVLAGALDGDLRYAREHAETVLAVMRTLERPRQLALLLENLADAELLARNYARAAELCDEALRARASVASRDALRPLFVQALALAENGETGPARAALERLGDATVPMSVTYWRDRFGLYLARAWHLVGDGERATRWAVFAAGVVAAVERDLPPARVETYRNVWWVRDAGSAVAGRWASFGPDGGARAKR